MHFPAADDALEPRATPLYAAAAGLSATNSWTSINGFASARVYTSVEEEYKAASEDAALVDLGPMRRYTLRGKDAGVILSRLTTTPVAEVAVGESARGLILDTDGFVVDFADLTRLSDDLYLLTTATPVDRRLQLAARGFEAEALNVGAMVAALGIAGPLAREAASAAGIDLLSADATAQGRVRGVELAIRPVGFGAAPGVEIMCPADEALVVFERLRRKRPLPAAGLEALEILRIEGGVPRVGVDFAGADQAGALSERRLPNEVGLPHLAPPNRAWFNGRRAMKSAPSSGRYLVVLSIDSDRAAPGAAIYAKGEAVGRITSSAFSPRLRRVVAFAELAATALDRPLEAAIAGPARAPARLHETEESRRAGVFRENLKTATESGRSSV
ncbi:MAG: glycine cleavage T C-terminal barrel domain-containing protein [Pseudomonadota bacterium]